MSYDQAPGTGSPSQLSSVQSAAESGQQRLRHVHLVVPDVNDQGARSSCERLKTPVSASIAGDNEGPAVPFNSVAKAFEEGLEVDGMAGGYCRTVGLDCCAGRDIDNIKARGQTRQASPTGSINGLAGRMLHAGAKIIGESTLRPD